MKDYKKKFPIGSQWKCRDGSRAVVVAHECGPFICWHENSKATWLHYVDGLCSIGFSLPEDLIEPWQEPKTIEGWVTVYEYSFGYLYESKEGAFNCNKNKFKKTIRITYNERDGVAATVEE